MPRRTRLARSRHHLATSHIQKALSQHPVSPGCGRCQACPLFWNPEPGHDPLQLDRETLPAADSSGSHAIKDSSGPVRTCWNPLSGQFFRGGSQNTAEDLKWEWATDFSIIVNNCLLLAHISSWTHSIWRRTFSHLNCLSSFWRNVNLRREVTAWWRTPLRGMHWGVTKDL